MAMELRKTVRLEGGTLLSPSNRRWQRQFKGLPKEQQKAIIDAGHVVVTKEDDEDEDAGEKPSAHKVTVEDLPAFLADVDDVNELRKMARRDKRTTAAPVYEARIAEVEGATKTDETPTP